MERLVIQLAFKKQVHQGTSSTRKKGQSPKCPPPNPLLDQKKEEIIMSALKYARLKKKSLFDV